MHTHRWRRLLGFHEELSLPGHVAIPVLFRDPFRPWSLQNVPTCAQTWQSSSSCYCFPSLKAQHWNSYKNRAPGQVDQKKITLKLRGSICMKKKLAGFKGEYQSWLNLYGFLLTIHGVTGMNRKILQQMVRLIRWLLITFYSWDAFILFSSDTTISAMSDQKVISDNNSLSCHKGRDC